jgi:hypothetical protein
MVASIYDVVLHARRDITLRGTFDTACYSMSLITQKDEFMLYIQEASLQRLARSSILNDFQLGVQHL